MNYASSSNIMLPALTVFFKYIENFTKFHFTFIQLCCNTKYLFYQIDNASSLNCTFKIIMNNATIASSINIIIIFQHHRIVTRTDLLFCSSDSKFSFLLLMINNHIFTINQKSIANITLHIIFHNICYQGLCLLHIIT